MSQYISEYTKGEKCRICKKPASHKLEEVIFDDDPNIARHSYRAYVCCIHFILIMGPAAKKYCEKHEHVIFQP